MGRVSGVVWVLLVVTWCHCNQGKSQTHWTGTKTRQTGGSTPITASEKYLGFGGDTVQIVHLVHCRWSLVMVGCISQLFVTFP